MNYAVIMAGGSGTRFWPKSTQKKPKQFLNLFDEKSLLQHTVERLDGIIPPERVMIVTNEEYVPIVREQLPKVPATSVVAEPYARNTAPCVAAAARILYNRDPDAVMVVLPADHHIADSGAFTSLLAAALEAALEKESLITIGIRPDRPETGYGYIRYDKSRSERQSGYPFFGVNRFMEKPDLETAKKFLQSGEYLWNSGMFIWKAETILKAFKTHQPDLFRLLDHLGTGEPGPEEIAKFYEAAPSISIDYAIMEHARNVYLFPGDFGWSDVGSWQAAYELAPKQESANTVVAGAVSLHGSSGNLIRSDSGKLIALVGVDHMAIVETDDAILVCDLKRSQDVREVIEHLKSEERLKKYL